MNNIARAASACLLAAAMAAAPPIHAQLPASFDGFDRFVEEQLAAWRTPGAQVAIVRDGRLVFAKGYGWRDLDKRLPMTAATVQPIGSIAKSMTAITLAKVVAQGKLGWDRPVRESMPDFRLADDSLASQVTLRDLMTHRSSFNGSDWVWYCAPDTREQLMAKLRHLELKGGLRERFQYSDSMYVVAGYLAGRAAGSTWEQLVQRDILDPLAMTSAGFTMAQYFRSPDHSMPYANDAQGNPRPMKPCEADAVGPAGGFLFASAEEMGRYVAMLASGGSYGGKTIIEARDLQTITAPQTVMSARTPYAEVSGAQYGMGFITLYYRGLETFRHNGSNDGWKARFQVLPSSRSGLYVAINSLEDELLLTLSYGILDRLAGLTPIDWTARFVAEREKTRATGAEARAKRAQARAGASRPSRDLADFAGTYLHAGYGSMTVSRPARASDRAALEATFHGFTVPLVHARYDVFEAEPTGRHGSQDPLQESAVMFLTGFAGDVTGLRFKMTPAADPVEFVRAK